MPKVPTNETRDAEPHGTEGANDEISINYLMSGTRWNRKDVDINDIFAYQVALDVMDLDEDHEPTSILECTQRSDWLKWKEAINVELESFKKRNVFGSIIRTPYNVNPVGYKWVFIMKRHTPLWWMQLHFDF
ncbi:hypothetical protein YC2023_057268 [Brassica napus]